MIRVVTDSTSDIAQEQARRLGIDVVPLTVFFGEEAYKDGVDMMPDAFYERLAGGDQPRTSQPSPEDFASVYRRHVDAGDDVISLHISARLSGTMQSATLAAEQVGGGRVHVVDSGTVSGGLGLLVARVLGDVAESGDVTEVLRRLDERKARAGIFAQFDTLVYLQRGGRIGRAQALVGGMLKVKPVIACVDGDITPVGRTRSRQQATDLILSKLAGLGEMESVAAFHAAAPDLLEAMVGRLRERYPDLDVATGELGPVVGTYAGPGALGVGYIRRG